MRKVQSLQKIPFPAPDTITKVVPVPTEGWDAISPLASMDPKRAPILDNWVPRPGWVELRAGYTPWSWVGSNNAVETLMVRRAASEEMFAAAGTAIYKVTNLGQYDTAVSGLSSARFQYVNFTPAGGTTVIQCCNGVDTLRQYNGTSWTAPSISGLPGGLSTSAITNIYAQKRRLWYILNNGVGGGNTIAAFMPTDAITGPISGYQDFGALWTKGSYLVSMSDWTVDGGAGPQDYAAFISSRGQVSVFSGDDPTNANSWSLVGTFDLSPPISRRCMTKVGSDVAVITQQGILPLSQALPFDPSADRSISITARIQNAMLAYSEESLNAFGWQVIAFPAQQLAIINVPLTENENQIQLVMNALTGAWCRFIGWNANCFEIFNDNLYFGGNDGTVNQGYSGGLDLTNPIAADMQCAFNYFDDPGRVKRVTMVQPLMTAGGSITPTLAVDEDFAISTTSAPISILVSGAVWDSAVWDVSTWPSGITIVKSWLSVQAIGHALAIHMNVNVASQSTTTIIGAFDMGVFDSAQFDQSGSSTAPILQVNAFNIILELGGYI